jgi:hypothetical protein
MHSKQLSQWHTVQSKDWGIAIVLLVLVLLVLVLLVLVGLPHATLRCCYCTIHPHSCE